MTELLSRLVVHSGDVYETSWLTGACAVWAIAALALVVYLLWARKIDGDDVFAICFVGLVGGGLWPVAVGAGTIWLVGGGSRMLVQKARDGIPERISKDERLARLRAENDRLREQIDREPDGIDIALQAEQ